VEALIGLPAGAILLGALGIVAATALSVTQAEHIPEALRETLKALEYLATFIAVVLAMHDDPDEASVRVALALTVTAVSCAALSQIFTGAPSVLLYAGQAVPRIAGPLEGPNQLSGYFGVTLPIVTAFALSRTAFRTELAALAIGVVALFLTFSRAGVVTSLAAIALVIAIAPSDRRKSISLFISTASLAGMGLILLLGELVAHDYRLLWRFVSFSESSDPGSVGTRPQLWHAAVSLWQMHPWLGIGAGNFELEISKVGPSGVKTHANSLYLQSLVEGGIPLLSAQLYALSASIFPFTRASLRNPLVLGTLAAGIGLALHQIVDLLVFYPKVGAMWWIALGLAASTGGMERERRILPTECRVVYTSG
jgi:O-antigen ligase